VLHRAWQFFRALFARVDESEYALVGAHLPPERVALFHRMHRVDQRHCLDVFYALRNTGCTDPVLLEAALIHDAGKAIARITIWHRVCFVLLGRFAPRRLARLAGDGQGWRAPFAAYLSHAERSARLAQKAGSAPEVVACIREHHRSESNDSRSATLQWADEQN